MKTTIEDLQVEQVYYFAATAYDDSGASDFSSEVEYTIFIPHIISISLTKVLK